MPTGLSIGALATIAAAAASRLGTAAAVEPSGAIAIGSPHGLVRVTLDPRGGGVCAVTPLFDSSGSLVSVLSGPVRATGDRDGLIEDVVSHFEECRSADLPYHPASAEVAKAISAAIASETGSAVTAAVARRPDAGFDVDVVTVEGMEDIVVFVAEYAAWVRSDGRDLPARDHSSRDTLVADFVAEMQDARPSLGMR